MSQEDMTQIIKNRAILTRMERRELKQFIRNNGLKVTVLKKHTDNDLRSLIFTEIGKALASRGPPQELARQNGRQIRQTDSHRESDESIIPPKTNDQFAEDFARGLTRQITHEPDHDFHPEEEEQSELVSHQELTPLTVEELREYIFLEYDHFPDISPEGIKEKLDRKHFGDQYGNEISIQKIKAFRRGWIYKNQDLNEKAKELQKLRDKIQSRKEEDERLDEAIGDAEDELVNPQEPENNPQPPPGPGRQELPNPQPQQTQQAPPPPVVTPQSQQQQPQQQPQGQPIYRPGTDQASHQPEPMQYQQQQYQQQPQPVPQQQPQQQVNTDLNINDFKKKTQLEVYIDNFNDARRAGDVPMQKMMGMGIFAEMDKADSGSSDPAFKLLNTVISASMGKNKDEKSDFDKMEQFTNMYAQINQGSGKSDAVGITEAVVEGAKVVSHEISDTILVASGNKNASSNMAVCPNCKKVVPVDSVRCPYCSARFVAVPQEGVYEEPQYEEQEGTTPPQMAAQHHQEQKGPMHSKYQPQPPQPPQPAAPGAPEEQMAPQPVERINMSEAENKEYTSYIKKLSNLIAQKNDPKQLIDIIWGSLDQEDKEKACLGVVLGPERLYYILERITPQYPDLKQNLDIIASTDGRAWINSALVTVKDKLDNEGFLTEEGKLPGMVKELQDKLGFVIPD